MNRHFISLLLLFVGLNLTAQTIKFETDFESGSLGEVVVVDSTSFFNVGVGDSIQAFTLDVFSRLDPLNPVDTTMASSGRWFSFRMTGVKNKLLFMNFHNTDPHRPMYSYDGKEYMRVSKTESPQRRKVTKLFRRDTVYMAYYEPYTYSYLNERLSKWKESDYVELQSIGKSTKGRDMTMMTITDQKISDVNKKAVYIHGRIHPSESPSSWHLDKMIEELVNPENPYAKSLRENIVFYILPFTNPDGVYEGLSRSNSRGVNIEVNYDKPDSLTEVEVENILSFLEGILTERKIDLFLNMHSQSLNQATYWVHNAESTSDEYFANAMRLCHLTTNDNPYFKNEDLLFSKVASRYLEGWFWNKTKGHTLSLTFETPYTYYSKNPDGEWVSKANLDKLAFSSLYAIGDYLKVSSPERLYHQVKNPFKKKLLIKEKYAPKGKYKVYAWRGEEAIKWEYQSTFTQKKNGPLKIWIKNPEQIITDIIVVKQ